LIGSSHKIKSLNDQSQEKRFEKQQAGYEQTAQMFNFQKDGWISSLLVIKI